MERRRLVAELRAATVDGRATGHAAVFNQVAPIAGGYEQIDPSAFDRALREGQDVVLLANHDGLPLARTSSGTLQLGVDGVGLTIKADLPDTTLGNDVRTLLERGDLNKMSFAFLPVAERWDDVDGVKVRTITDLDLFDVSIVTYPAYTGTDVALRSRSSIHIKPTRKRRASGQAALIRAKALLKGEK